MTVAEHVARFQRKVQQNLFDVCFSHGLSLLILNPLKRQPKIDFRDASCREIDISAYFVYNAGRVLIQFRALMAYPAGSKKIFAGGSYTDERGFMAV
ncbi:MAG TPA: hypothetical protein PKA19_08345 [Bacillota bacterium]|nr:hypothetical protein [Bacillota bacterium]